VQSNQVPAKFPIPWGNSAGAGFIRSIPTPSQIGTQDGAASLTDGFPPKTMTPIGVGGAAPFGQDMNGILRQLSQWCRWVSAGGPIFFDSAFATAIGGYPLGAVVLATGASHLWMSTIENNTTDPDAGLTPNWVNISNKRTTRYITASATVTVGAGDYAIGLNRTSSPAPTTIVLPNLSTAADGQEFVIEDLANNFYAYPVSLTLAGSGTFNGGIYPFPLNVNGSSNLVRFYAAGGANIWAVGMTPPRTF
jgi:hypothetical protein